MTTPRTPPARALRLAVAASLALAAGCGGNPPEVDTAETIRNEPAKPTPPPAPGPEATPSKEAPKG